MNIYTPFTYCVTFKPNGQRYYGVRTKKGCHPTELWTTYFTSSKKVKNLILKYGPDSFEFEIRKTFTTKMDAIAWECKVLRRLKVLESDLWLNENIGGKSFVTKDTLTEEHKRNVGNAQRGKKKKPCSEDRKRKISAAKIGKPAHNKGKPMSEDQKQLLSKIRKGSKSSEETRAKISQSQVGRVQSDETRYKQAAAMRLYWANKKALSGLGVTPLQK